MRTYTILRGGKANLGSFQVKRLLPSAQKMMVGPFIFMDYGGPTLVPRSDFDGVPEHPHSGLSTFTLLLSGSALHRDSADFEQVIRAGDIALMTAGRGITHEELPAPDDHAPDRDMHFVQMWLALPNAVEDIDPDFEHHPADSLPVLRTKGAEIRLLMGEGWGMTAPTTCFMETVFAHIILAPGAEISLDQNSAERGLFVLQGEAALSGENLPGGSQIALVKPDTKPILSSKAGAELILLGGAVFPDKRFIKWNFVGSSPERVQQHFDRWTAGDWKMITRKQGSNCNIITYYTP